MPGGPDRLTAVGEWWLPGNDAHQVFGTLTVDHRCRGTLKTAEPVSRDWYGDLVERVSPTAGTLQELVVPQVAVHGRINGKECTLLGCDVLVEPAGGLGLGLDVEAVVEGVLIRDEDDQAFSGFRLGVENLAAFAELTTLEQRSGDSPLRRRCLEPVRSQVGELGVAIVWVPHHGFEMSRTGKTVTFGETVVFDVTSTSPVSVKELRKVRRQLQDLVTFVTGTASAITLLTVRLSSRTDTEAPQRAAARMYEPWPQSPTGEGGIVVPADLVMRLGDIPWQDLLSTWFANYEGLRPVLGTLLAHRFLPMQFVDNNALHLVIAAEQAYRVLGFDDYFMSEGLLSRLRKMVRAAMVDDDELAQHVDRVNEQLQRRASLDERLRALIGYVGDPARVLLNGAEGVEQWVVAAKRARNDLGHTGHTQRLSVPALGAIAHGAEALLELVVAKRLGLNDDGLAALVKRRHLRVTARLAMHLRQTG